MDSVSQSVSQHLSIQNGHVPSVQIFALRLREAVDRPREAFKMGTRYCTNLQPAAWGLGEQMDLLDEI